MSVPWTSETVLFLRCRDEGFLSVQDPASGPFGQRDSFFGQKTVTGYQAGPFSFMLAEAQFSVLEQPITLQPKTSPSSP
eukprot:3821553-Pleurochrysis_carterae.AAC.2